MPGSQPHPRSALYAPLIHDPVYGYPAVNVLRQKASEHSLLNWMQRIIQVRSSTGVFGRGLIEFLYPANHRILAYVRRLDNEAVLVVNNLAGTAQAVDWICGDTREAFRLRCSAGICFRGLANSRIC